MSFDSNPRDDMPFDREGYEAWELEEAARIHGCVHYWSVVTSTHVDPVPCAARCIASNDIDTLVCVVCGQVAERNNRVGMITFPAPGR